MLETLDAAAVRRWSAGALAALRRHQGEIDELNVYPVPDGDTGTNLVLTLTAAHRAAEATDADGVAEGTDATDAAGATEATGATEGTDATEPDSADPAPVAPTPHGRVLRQMARGALLGARGNSGVIVSQILRGLADALAEVAAVRGHALATALRAATTAAYAAVAKPVEGTVLTVADAAASAAERAGTNDLCVVARAAAAAGAAALARTPQQLPELARAGVVDAGGRGLCLLLDALVEVVSGEPVGPRQPTPVAAADSAVVAAPVAAAAPAAATAQVAPVDHAEHQSYGYEVQFLLDAEEAAVERLRAALGQLGDSLVVAATGEGQPPTWQVHVHVDDVGAALEEAVVAGRPHRISVTRFADQTRPGQARPDQARPGQARPDQARPDQARPGPAASRSRAAVVVAAGPGLARIFAAEGATVVRGNPSTGELLEAIRATGAARVVVLPNDANTRAVAGAAARAAEAFGIRASVVPTRSPVQALAALAVRDEERRFDDDVIAMAEAAGACRYAEVCYASRAALTIAGPCRPGDVLALVEGEVNLVGTGLLESARELLDRMLGGGGELVTLLTGAEAPPDLADALRAHLAARWPFVETQVYDGGQPFYPLLVGVE